MAQREEVLRWVHTGNITAYFKYIALQVTDTILSYELNFHSVPHGVTVSCERYTVGFPVCYGSPSDVFAASSGFVHLYIYIYYALKKKSGGVGKGNSTQAGKCKAVQVCWQT